MTEIIKMSIVPDPRKAALQAKAKEAWINGGEWGALYMATRSGKSKVAIDIVYDLSWRKDDTFSYPSVYLVVPTQKLRDTNWETEFNAWDKTTEYNNLQRYCYASINKVKGQTIDLVIFDEGHNLTPANAAFLQNNTVRRVLVLTATPPKKKGNSTEEEKWLLFQQFRIKADFEYSLEQAIADGVVAPYEIKIVEVDLDDSNKYIQAGRKGAHFMTTEKKHYAYLSQLFIKMQGKSKDNGKFVLIARMRLVYNSIAKTAMAKKLIAKMQGKRFILFCGGIDQAEELMPGRTFHSKTNDKALEAFKAEEIDELAVVAAMNEGHTIKNVDGEIIVQLDASTRTLVQRIGRSVAVRPGHIAEIWIILARGTQDVSWFKKASAEFDKASITYIHENSI